MFISSQESCLSLSLSLNYSTYHHPKLLRKMKLVD